jgi:hypothetical protein
MPAENLLTQQMLHHSSAGGLVLNLDATGLPSGPQAPVDNPHEDGCASDVEPPHSVPVSEIVGTKRPSHDANHDQGGISKRAKLPPVRLPVLPPTKASSPHTSQAADAADNGIDAVTLENLAATQKGMVEMHERLTALEGVVNRLSPIARVSAAFGCAIRAVMSSSTGQPAPSPGLDPTVQLFRAFAKELGYVPVNETICEDDDANECETVTDGECVTPHTRNVSLATHPNNLFPAPNIDRTNVP